jgi:spore germination protein YaaH
MELEKELFETFDIEASVTKNAPITLRDIRKHLTECVVERDSIIQTGKMIGELQAQLSLFVEEMDKYRLLINSSEKNPDMMLAYNDMFKNFRTSVDSIRKYNPPQRQAEDIKNNAIKPLVIQLLRTTIEQFRNTKDYVVNAFPEAKDRMEESFRIALKNWGEIAESQHKQSLVKMAEILGVQPSDLMK